MLTIVFTLSEQSEIELSKFTLNMYILDYGVWGLMLEHYEKHCGAKVDFLWEFTHSFHGEDHDQVPFSIEELKTAAERLKELKELYLTGEKVEYLPGMIFQEKDADLDDFHEIDMEMDNETFADIIDDILELWHAAINEGIPFGGHLYDE